MESWGIPFDYCQKKILLHIMHMFLINAKNVCTICVIKYVMKEMTELFKTIKYLICHINNLSKQTHCLEAFIFAGHVTVSPQTRELDGTDIRLLSRHYEISQIE